LVVIIRFNHVVSFKLILNHKSTDGRQKGN
jgi:hypothetical protein